MHQHLRQVKHFLTWEQSDGENLACLSSPHQTAVKGTVTDPKTGKGETLGHLSSHQLWGQIRALLTKAGVNERRREEEIGKVHSPSVLWGR